jgi:hypothetical protein
LSSTLPDLIAVRIQPEALPRLRVAARIATSFLLDTVGKVSGGRDLTDTAIVIGIVQANLAPVLADIRLQRAYAGEYDPPPTAVRRPISVNAIAASLKLPFETVRRRVHQLAAEGMCEVTPLGLVVPEAPLVTPQHRALLHANFQDVRKLYRDLRLTGCLPPFGGPEVEPLPSPPIRAVARLSSDYALRMVDPIVSHIGDLTDGFVLMAIFDLNTRHLPLAQTAAALDPHGFLPDEYRRPASVTQIAGRLNLGYELVRRRLRRLEREGRCQAAGSGVLVPSAAFLRPGLAEFIVSNHANLQRMFAGAAQLGVTQAWDRELAAEAGEAT